MIAALFAVDDNGGMGNDGGLPWPMNKDDMKWFKGTTEGQVVAMGRRSWDSHDMPKPLPKRHNVLFTSKFLERTDIQQISGDVCEGLKLVESEQIGKDVFVIGGANLLMQAKPVLDSAYITRIPGEYFCDTTIDLDAFLEGFRLVNTLNLGSCIVEEYEAV